MVLALALAGLLALSSGGVAPAVAQAGPTDDRPVVMLVGMYHFSNPDMDVVNIRADDVLTEQRQGEIRALTDQLARFQPTVIAVEETSALPTLDSPTLPAWRAGDRAQSRNERDQLGFRLADRTGARVAAVDVDMPLPFGPLMQAAEAHAPAVMARVMSTVQADVDATARALAGGSIADALVFLNSPEALRRNDSLYYIPLAISPDDGVTLPGVDVALAWYERNLRICARLMSVATPGARVLVIYGSSHVPQLAQCLSAAGARLEDPLPYLSAAR